MGARRGGSRGTHPSLSSGMGSKGRRMPFSSSGFSRKVRSRNILKYNPDITVS